MRLHLEWLSRPPRSCPENFMMIPLDSKILSIRAARMFMMAGLACATSFAATTHTARAQETGDLKIQFKYGGDAPQPKPITPTADGVFCGQHSLVDPSLIVNEENGGLKNVVVYVYTGRGGSKLDDAAGDPQTVVLANKNCQFEPHIVLAKVGDTLKVTNPDEVGHNANIQFFKNKAINPTIPAGQEVSVELKKEEPAPIPVTCNIHPWMTARLVVLEHPFAGVSDADGHLTIEGLPAGETLVFRAFHENARIKEATIDGKNVDWKRSRFEVEIKPGINDMGTVVLDADQFN